MPQAHQFVLTLACPDAKGIVHAVSGLLYQAGCNIIDSQQFGDLEGDDATGLFFMRVHFQAPPQLADAGHAGTLFEHTRQQFGMQVHFHALAAAARAADGQPARPLPERPAVPLEERLAAGGHPGHRLQPPHLRSAGRQLRHPVPPPAAGRWQQRRNQARAGAAGRSADREPRRSTSSCWRATCRS
jgi:predicted amino acid-binding ACT domain protein